MHLAALILGYAARLWETPGTLLLTYILTLPAVFNSWSGQISALFSQ